LLDVSTDGAELFLFHPLNAGSKGM
jgi:hypothetical protein